MLLLPILWSLCQFQKTKTIDEHRILAAFPGFGASAGSFQNYTKQLERYFNDHFGCRELLITCNLKIRRDLFPIEMGSDVLIGHDGWFYYLGEDMINNRLGAKRFTLQQLKAWQILLEKRHDWLAAHGIKYLFVIAPNKESVYPEHLPGWLRQTSTTRLDQFIEYMHLHSTVEILDLRFALREARKHDPVFYKTDTHWNLMGGFAASEAIISKAAGQISVSNSVVRENFEIQRKRGLGGDLARLAAEPNLLDDNIYAFQPKRQLPKLKFNASSTNVINYTEFEAIPVPLISIVTTTNNQYSTKVIIFGDSFAVALEPFLGYNFGKAIFLSRSFDSTFIMQDKPAIVMEEMVERYFNSKNPVGLLKGDNLDVP